MLALVWAWGAHVGAGMGMGRMCWSWYGHEVRTSGRHMSARHAWLGAKCAREVAPGCAAWLEGAGGVCVRQLLCDNAGRA